MKYLLWDFDNTLGYREGMWSGTLHSILISNEIHNIHLEDILPFLNIGFTWHSPETPHSLLFNGKTWWEYMNDYFVEVYEKVGIAKKEAIKYALQVQNEYKNINKWHLPLLLPYDLSDLFAAAAWRRPELYLQTEVRAGISSFALGNQDLIEQGVQLLRADLSSGDWTKKYGNIHNLTEIDLGYRFIHATLDK